MHDDPKGHGAVSEECLPTICSSIEEEPDKITVKLTKGQGAEAVILEKTLSLYEMQQLHVKLTAALWWRMMQS